MEGRPGSNNIGINTVKIRVVKPLGDSVPSFYAPDCATTKTISSECFSDWRGGNTTILSLGRSPKQPLPGIGLHKPLHGRQACPKFKLFHQGTGQISPREGLFLCHPLPKRGYICDIPPPSQSLNDSVLAEIMEARAADTSRRVITKEERRLLFHYFTLGPPTPLQNTSSCEDAPSGACTPSGTSTAPGHGDGREAGGFSQKDLVHSSSDDEEAGKAQGGHPMNAAVPPRDGPLGEGEGSVPTRGETRAVESETRRGGRRSGSALRKVFSKPKPHGIDVMESTEAGARGQQHPDTAAVGEIVDGG